MRRYLNRFFTELAALFLSCLLISCSALFNSSDTGSVSFSLSSEQLRAIVSQTNSARALTQGDVNTSDVSEKDYNSDWEEPQYLVLQLAVYSYDFQTFKSGQLRYSYYEIESGVQKTITLDEIPVGQYALVALLYQDESMMGDYMSDGIESYYKRQPLYCGAEESIYVRGGTQTADVTMIDFKGAFIDGDEDYSEIPYYDFNLCYERAVAKSIEEDSYFGKYCIVASDDKPFYALLTENYGIVSIGLVEGSPKSRTFNIRELATIGTDISSFNFLQNTNVIKVYVSSDYMAYKIDFHGTWFEFEATGEPDSDKPSGDDSGEGEAETQDIAVKLYFYLLDSEEEGKTREAGGEGDGLSPYIIDYDIYYPSDSSEPATGREMRADGNYADILRSDLKTDLGLDVVDAINLKFDFKLYDENSDGLPGELKYKGEKTFTLKSNEPVYEWIYVYKQN